MSKPMQFQRAHSFVPPKQQTDVPVFNRAQSFVSGQGIEMSVNTLYNHAVRYHKTEKDMDLAESAFKAALSRDPNHISSLVGIGSLLKELGREEEGNEFLHKATGLIMCPRSLPGEDKIRHLSAQRNKDSVKTILSPADSKENLSILPPKAPVRMGSMKAILAMNAMAAMADVTNAKKH